MTSTRFKPQLQRAMDLVINKQTELSDAVLEVPFDYYRSPDNASVEKERIWEWAPLVLCVSAQIPAANDFMVREVFGKSILIVRGDDEQVRAFENYCRHRGGNPACGEGNQRVFICPYHAWSYDSRGRLKGVPAQDSVGDIDRAKHNLVELPCEERHGLIWVKIKANSGIDVAGFLGDELDEELAIWNYSTGYFFPKVDIDVKSNWKAVVENFGETYHFTKVHGDSIPGELQAHNTATHDALGLHYRELFPFKTISALADTPEADWKVLEHATVVYWIFPSLVLVNVHNVTQVIDTLPLDDNTSRVTTVSIGSADPSEPGMVDAMRETVEAARYALIQEDGPILDSLGQSIFTPVTAGRRSGVMKPVFSIWLKRLLRG